MFQFAQTNLQLQRQLHELGYANDAMARVAAAYDLALPLFSAQYRGSGKSFSAHLVGTASILASRQVPADTLIAGLLHATYMTGDLGFHPGRRRSTRQRAWLRERIGVTAEERVAMYDSLRWNADTIADYRTRYGSFDSVTREVLSVRLANTYEDFMDGALCLGATGKASLYCNPVVQENLLALAELAAWPQLADLLGSAFQEFNHAQKTLAPTSSKGFSALRLPPSARRRLLPAIEGWLTRRWRRLRQSPP